MAISLILMVGSLAQIVIWLASARIAAPPTNTPSAALVHGWLFQLFEGLLTESSGSIGDRQPLLFATTLIIGLMSTIGWYAAIRLGLGPGWGLWTALLWAAHPGFAFLIQRPSSLILVIALVPAVYAGLVWCTRSDRWITGAVLSGSALGALSLCGTLGIALIPVVLAGIMFGRRPRVRRVTSSLIALAACVAIVLPCATRVQDPAARSQFAKRLSDDWWDRLPSEALAEQAKAWRSAEGSASPASPAKFLLSELRSSPLVVTQWFAQRVWRTLYGTSDGGLQRPLFALQLATLAPAVWGFWVAIRHRPWRWLAWVSLAFVAVSWLLAALIEPLARNLAPAGAIAVMFALVGVADLYERTFGRRVGRQPHSSGRRPRYT